MLINTMYFCTYKQGDLFRSCKNPKQCRCFKFKNTFYEEKV